MTKSAGLRFKHALKQHKPLQIVGTINAYTATMAQKVGFDAIYLSGAGVANASFGLPDLAMTTLSDVLEDARRITARVETPLLVDIDTGFGGAFNIARTIKEMIRAGVAAVHIEDQVSQKRCGHRPNKEIVSCDEMCDRIKAAVDARTDNDFVIMARTDALAVSGLDAAVDRAGKFVAAGADMIFAEALTDIAMYRRFKQQCKAPLLANMTEFGQSPLYTASELAEHGVDMVLYPLSAFRAMNQAALDVYRHIKDDGSQQKMVAKMQTRAELYQFLDYHQYEASLDKLQQNK